MVFRLPVEEESSLQRAAPPGLSAPPLLGGDGAVQRWPKILGRQRRRHILCHQPSHAAGGRGPPAVSLPLPDRRSHPRLQGSTPAEWLSSTLCAGSRASPHLLFDRLL